MVTRTSGQISCTARAMIWARSWRISSSAGASSLSVFRLIVASWWIGQARSQCRPPTCAEIAALASDGAIDAATSAGVTPGANRRLLPSGNVREIWAMA